MPATDSCPPSLPWCPSCLPSLLSKATFLPPPLCKAFDETNEKSLHMLGMYGPADASLAMQNADLVIALSTSRFNQRTSTKSSPIFSHRSSSNSSVSCSRSPSTQPTRPSSALERASTSPRFNTGFIPVLERMALECQPKALGNVEAIKTFLFIDHFRFVRAPTTGRRVPECHMERMVVVSTHDIGYVHER